MMKRVLSILLAAVMMLSVLPVVSAEGTAEVVKFDIVGCNPNLESELELGIVFAKENIPEGKEFTATVTQISGGEEVNVFTFAQDEWETYGRAYYRVPVKMAAKCMADDFSIEITDAEGNVWNNPYSTSYRTYVMNNFDKTDDEARQTLFVDMLNYGAAAQERFDYNVEDLANNRLTDEQQALSLGDVTLKNKQVKGNLNLGTSASLESRILVYSVFRGMNNEGQMYAEVSYTDARGNEQSVTIPGKDFILFNGAQKAYKVCVDTLVPADVNVAYTMTVYNADGTVFDTAVDGLGSYLSRNMEKDPIYGAVATFGMAAKNYFVGDIDVDDGAGDDTVGNPDDGYVLEDEAIASVQAGEDGTVQEEVTMEGETVSATVPAGVAVESETLTLIVGEKKSSDSDVAVKEEETALSLEVHVDGVAATNNKAILVSLGEVLEKGLNLGNLALYHVENGETVAMTQVLSLSELDEHNEFYYDPATGEVTVALASFSEIMLVNEPAAWEGGYNYNWYHADAQEFEIANGDQLAALSAIVGGMEGQTQDSFAGKYIKLVNDIDLNDAEKENDPDKIFYPIGYYNSDGTYEKTGTAITSGFKTFEGTFDGNGHTISNFYQNTWEMKGDHEWYDAELQYYRDGMGLFGKVYGGTVKNLTIENFSSDGEITTTGCVATYADCGAEFENIAIFNCNPRVYNIGNGGIVGCVGWYAKEEVTEPVTFTNITVDNSNKISALWGSYDVACGGIVGQYYPTSGQTSAGSPANAGVHFENCHVAAVMDVYNDVCANYQYYAYRYTGMLIGSIRENVNGDDGHVYPKMDGITAEDCTVHFGDWNDYYYCELVANSLASYTHDHQMSRLTQVASVDVENKQITDLDGNTADIPAEGRVNYVVVKAKDADGMWVHGDGHDYAECYHFVNGVQHFHDVADTDNPNVYETVNGEETLKEDKQLVYREFDQLCTGYGWGVTSKGIGDMDGVTILDREEEGNSIVKFEYIGENSFIIGEEVKLGTLFRGIADDIKSDNVQVFVSAVGETSTASAVYTANAENWAEGTLIFSGEGAATITITDYYFCTPTTVTITVSEEQPVDKFVPIEGVPLHHTLEGGTVSATLGTLFSAVAGAEIDSAAVEVTVNGLNCEITKDAADWMQNTLTFSGVGTATVTVTADALCNPATATVTVAEPAVTDKFSLKFENTDQYLYRVGNKNTVSLGSLFAADLPTGAEVSVAVEALDGMDVTYTYTPGTAWTAGTIQFAGAGPVQVTVDSNAYTNPCTLKLEVVNAYNVTTYSELKDQTSVLLSDITMSGGGTYRLTGNKTLYGNGFTFNVKNGAYAGVEYDYASYVTYLENSTLDNVKITGAVYPEPGGTKADDYYRAIVMVNGECKIINSYISNGASPIRNGGNLELINTTLAGGAWANLDQRSGHLILDNVTTVNQVNANEKYGTDTTVIGMGIVVYQEGGTADMKITIRNGLTQYNYLSETEANTYLTSTYASLIKDKIFGTDFSAYQNNGLVNLGIISMNNYFTADSLVDERTDKTGYFGQATTISVLTQSRDCYVYSFKPTVTAAPAYPGYATAGQGIMEPTVEFDFVEKNYQAKEGDSNDYCVVEGTEVFISMDEGDVFNWDTSILTAAKHGKNLAYTVSLDEVDYTGKSIAFNETGVYQVKYAFTDPYNYDYNATAFSKDYEEVLTINVSVVKATARNAVFSFGASGTEYSGKTVVIGDKTYVMPDVTATVSGKIGSTTVNSTTVYYPITEMYTSDGKTAHTGSWYACFPIFKDALQIIDYADQGTGDSVTYNQEKVTTVAGIPSTLKATNPTSAFLYSMNATNYPPPTDPTAVSGAVCYTCNRNGLTSGNTRNEMNIVAEYTYTDNAGKVYYYYIGYHCDAQTKGSSPCVTPDTLVMLADGTQKRIDEVTYEDQLLTWDFVNGEYTAMPASIIMNHGEEEATIIKLDFADGTTVKAVNVHGFFLAEDRQYVLLDGENADDYVGYSFLKQDGNGYTETVLENVTVTTEVTEVWSVLTAVHHNAILEGMWTLTAAEVDDSTKYLMPFAVGEDMKYDETAMAEDIAQYGLYTYEDFEEYMTYEQFVALNLPIFKVSVGKGYITYDEIMRLIEIHIG